VIHLKFLIVYLTPFKSYTVLCCHLLWRACRSFEELFSCYDPQKGTDDPNQQNLFLYHVYLQRHTWATELLCIDIRRVLADINSRTFKPGAPVTAEEQNFL
jgi:hypothetical protein